MPKKKQKRKPNEAPVVFHSEDKEYDNAPYEHHAFSPCASDRILFVGKPGVGKSAVMKNYLVRSGAEKVWLSHGMGDKSQEYSLVDYEHLDLEKGGLTEKLMEESKKLKKGRMIWCIDDYNYSDMNKTARANLYSAAQFACTHGPCVLLAAAHSFTQIPPRLRRIASTFVLWAPSEDALAYMARCLAVDKLTLKRIFSKCKTRHDFIVYEVAPTPYSDDGTTRARWRMNGHLPLTDAD